MSITGSIGLGYTYILTRTTTTSFAPLHWCCDTTPCSGIVLYMEGPVLIHLYWRHHSNNWNSCQDATSDHLHHLCTVSDCFLILLNVSLPKIAWTCSPTKKLFHKLVNSIQTIHQLPQNSHNGHSLWWNRGHLHGKC